MTSASHAEGRQFNPGWVYAIFVFTLGAVSPGRYFFHWEARLIIKLPSRTKSWQREESLVDGLLLRQLLW